MHEKLQVYMAECGLPSSHVDLNLDGTIHRYGKEGPQDDKAEWYIGFELDNGEIYCSFGSWSHDQEKHTYKSWNDNNPHAEKYLEQAKILREKQLEEERHASKKALEYTSKVWDAAPLASHEHPYLRRKKVKAHGIKTHQGKLLVPRYDSSGLLSSVQTIDTDGLKKNAAGLPCKSTYFIIGETDNPRRIRFCEGYATGATLYELTRDMVVVCFSCGNIKGSTFLIREKFPNAHLILNGDKKTEKLCEEWKGLYKGLVQIPEKCEGSDFNDLFIEKGKETALSQLEVQGLNILGADNFLTQEIPPLKPILTYKIGGAIEIEAITEASLNFIYAGAGVGKTMYMYDLAAAISTGQGFMKFNTPHRKKVLYVDAEMNAYHCKKRFLDIVRTRKIQTFDGHLDIYNKSFEMSQSKKSMRINLNSHEYRKFLDEYIDRYDVIFFDNLKNCSDQPGGSGNHQISHGGMWEEIGEWIRGWKAHNKVFFIAHHENKNGQMLGAENIRMDADYVIHLTRPKEFPSEGFSVVYEFEKTREMPQGFSHQKMLAFRNPNSEWTNSWDVNPYEE